ncbi:MAG TPA: hypothetical protein VD993_07405 [Chitinophagaceae bacterium]|nr:hypothetical protein [Chitinophagaceae bacterium]
MKKLLVVLMIGGIIFACNQNQDGVDGPVSGGPGTKFCDSGSGNVLCPYLPVDVDTNFSVGYDSYLDSSRQPPFDQFSWQTFIALNWPANASGQPIGNSIGDNPDSMRVWEYYMDPAQVFGGNTQELVLHMGTAKRENQKLFYMDSKSPEALMPVKGFKEADGHPLIDRNLNFALYEIKMNPTEVNFVTQHSLTTKAGIAAYAKAHDNRFELPSSDSASGNPGTIEIKASWRILDHTKGDDTTRFYCRNAIIYIDSGHVVNHKPLVIRAKVGLVGMHIVRKTQKFDMMIWSTFEHIDNTPDDPQSAQMDTRKKWSFYNPECLNCLPNDTPAFQQGDNKRYRWDSTPPWAKRYAVPAPSQPGDSFGTQVVRVYPVYKYTNRINDAWRAQLRGTVWVNYRLIGSQWQSAETFPPPNAPALLANATLETYIQPTASCITCHGDAKIKFGAATIPTDLSFIFPVYAK